MFNNINDNNDFLYNSQLEKQGKSEKLEEVLREVPRVREDAGFPPLVTPSSQIVGTQAVLNVLSGVRYKMVTKEFKGLLRGEYGRTPGKINPEILYRIVGDEAMIPGRPADALEPELERLRGEIEPWFEQDEDVLTYALFENVAKDFFEYRKAKRYGLDAVHGDPALGVHPV